MKHTNEGCFKIIGYPEWWDDHRQRKVVATKAPICGKLNLVFGIDGKLTIQEGEELAAINPGEWRMGHANGKNTEEEGDGGNGGKMRSEKGKFPK